jgi:putative SOS response-associated peptidase YedK
MIRRIGSNQQETFPWADDPAIGNRMVNARSESVDSKPSFRKAYKKRRCLIPADGFYEWKGKKAPKQPIYVTTPDDEPFGFAGLWEVWDNKGKMDAPLYTCTILTTDASDAIKNIHDRMPVILKPEAYQDWIDEKTPDEVLKDILKDKVQKAFALRPVSKAVNKVENNSPDLIKEE